MLKGKKASNCDNVVGQKKQATVIMLLGKKQATVMTILGKKYKWLW
jgi:hypothetical protein